MTPTHSVWASMCECAEWPPLAVADVVGGGAVAAPAEFLTNRGVRWLWSEASGSQTASGCEGLSASQAPAPLWPSTHLAGQKWQNVNICVCVHHSVCVCMCVCELSLTLGFKGMPHIRDENMELHTSSPSRFSHLCRQHNTPHPTLLFLSDWCWKSEEKNVHTWPLSPCSLSLSVDLATGLKTFITAAVQASTCSLIRICYRRNETVVKLVICKQPHQKWSFPQGHAPLPITVHLSFSPAGTFPGEPSNASSSTNPFLFSPASWEAGVLLMAPSPDLDWLPSTPCCWFTW